MVETPVENKTDPDPPKEDQKKGKQESKLIERIKWSLLVIFIIAVTVSTIVLAKNEFWPRYRAFQARRQTAKAQKKKEQKEEMGPIFEIKDLTVNPYGSNGLRFALLELALEADSDDLIQELEQREPQIKDLLIHYFRNKSIGEILDPGFQDSSTVILMQQINERLYEGQLDSLYYVKLVVQ